MGSGARLAAAALLAVVTLTGPAAGTSGADKAPVPDRGATDGDSNPVSERRSLARVPEQRRAEPRPRCHRRDSDCGAGVAGRDRDDLESPSDRDGSGWPTGRLPGSAFPPPEAPPLVPPPLGADPDVLDTVPGVDLPLTAPAGAPVSVPVLPVAPGAVGPRPAGSAAAAPRPEAPRGPRTPEPATALTSPVPAASRAGYPEYLRAAGLPQIAAVALPGLAGILVLTAAGGLVGYRQASAGRAGADRPLNRFMT
ncbi:hypothetical protein ACQI4F_08120 [Mycolicibacterium vaccae]|uniref:hypothetical protein n=1 Tax=Mycolicibacterium vaccae TaxID=1810 RepID=UPI003CE68867